MRAKSKVSAAIAFVFLCASAYPDQVGQKVIAEPVETELCGVEIGKVPIDRIYAKFGKPSANMPIPDGQEYEWRFGAVRMLVVASSRSKSGNPDYIDVSGKRATKSIGRTGRGLALGDNLTRVRELYGTKYLEPSKSEILFEFTNGNKLTIRFDRNGRINYMELTAKNE